MDRANANAKLIAKAIEKGCVLIAKAIVDKSKVNPALFVESPALPTKNMIESEEDAIPTEWIIKQIQEQSLGESKAYSKLLKLWESESNERPEVRS